MEDSTRDTEKAEEKEKDPKDQEDPVDATAPAIIIQDERFVDLSTTPALNYLHEEVVERDSLQAQQLPSPLKSSSSEPTPSPPSSHSSEEKEHLDAELAITKAKLCHVTQQLEEKTAQLRDSQHKNIQLVVLAQRVKTFQEQLDALKEKAKRADQLQMELVRCKDELGNLDFYKAGMEELRKHNSILLEAKSMLEEQLAVARAWRDQVDELEKENLQLKAQLRNMELDRDIDRKHIEELLEENIVLEVAQKHNMSESAHLVWELEQLSENTDMSDDLSHASRRCSVPEMSECASSRILTLEEKQRLRCSELDEENQQLSKKIEELQNELESERQTISDLQSFSEELLEEKEQMRSDLQSLRANSSMQVQMLEEQNHRLNEEVLLLQVMSLGSSEVCTEDIEPENQVLHETSSKLSKLEFERQCLRQDLEQMQERVKQGEQLEEELHCLQKENRKLAQEFTSLTALTSEKIDALECENQGLRLENQELSKSLDTLPKMSVQLEGLERDNRKLNEENLELRRMVETMRSTSANVAPIEMENQELRQEEEKLWKIVQRKALSRKLESLELSHQNLSAEDLQLRQTPESRSQKAQALQQELREPQAENQAQQREQEAQPLVNEQLEGSKDRKALEQEGARLQKDQKRLEEGVKQPQQQGALKDTVSDDRTAKLSSALDQGLAHCKDVATQLKELDKDNRHLTKEVTMHTKRLRTLRVELVLEKVKNQQLNTELEKLSQDLEMRRRRKVLPLQDDSSHSNMANFLHQKLKGQREELRIHILRLETSLQHSQLGLSHRQAQVDQQKEPHQSLDNHHELLSHLKKNLEGKNPHLRGQLNMLNQQNQELLEQNTESKEPDREEQKQSIDQLNDLQRKSETLEEKAREPNESCDPAPKKKHHLIGAKRFINFMKRKKEGGGEHLQSASDGTPWPLESSDPAMPSTSQPPKSPLEPLEATPSCSKWVEEQDTPKVPSGKATQHIKNPFYRRNRKNKEKSTAAQPNFLKCLWCWSSPNGPSSPEEPLPPSEQGDC